MNNEVEAYEGELRHLRERCGEQQEKIRELVLTNAVLTERLRLVHEIAQRIRVKP